ncbi:MAG: thiamine pyrophosphate-dependent dehydrogenase E1 component subunit alpha [Bacteroidota bacterium]
MKSTDGKNSESGLTKDDLLKLYFYMRLTREFEETVNRLYNQGKVVGGAYSGRGNEATSVGSTYALAKEDYVFPMHRDLGSHIVKGQTIRRLMLQYLGRKEGMTAGRDGTGHYADPKLKIYGNISHLGAMVPVAAGVALASKIRDEHSVVLTYIGDGGASVGEVHEGLAFASALKLPFVLIIENNQFAYSTPVTKQTAAKNFADRAIGYGIPGVTIDGTDILEVYRICSDAFARARSGGGPTIIESVTMRMQGHAAHDNAWYVPKDLIEEWKAKDPIDKFERINRERGILTDNIKTSFEKGIETTLEDAVNYALAAPYPPGEDILHGLYAG